MPLLAFLPLVICAAICLLPAYLLRRRTYARAQDFFVASDITPPGEIRNASIGYALQAVLLGAFFASGANGDLWPVIIAALAFGLGLGLLYRLRAPILTFLDEALAQDRSVTIHEFIARSHGSDVRVRVLASALTVLALCGLLSGEAFVVATMLKPVLEDAVSADAVMLALVLLAVLCTAMSGNSGALRAAQSQLGLLYLGLFGATALLLYLQVSELRPLLPHGMLAVVYFAACCTIVFFSRRTRYVDTSAIRKIDSDNPNVAGSGSEAPGSRPFRRYEKILNVFISIFVALIAVTAGMELYSEEPTIILRDSMTALHGGTRVPALALIAIVLLPLCYPIIDVTNWQRLAAFAKNTYPSHAERHAVVARLLRSYAIETPLLWLFMGMFGAIAVIALESADGVEVIEDFIEQLLSEPNVVTTGALWLLLLAVFAMALSTMIALFSAALCAIRYDILPAIWPDLAAGEAEPGPPVPLATAQEAIARRRSVLIGAGLALLILAAYIGAGPWVQGDLTSGQIVTLLLAFYSIQLSFVPLVLGPVIGGTAAGCVSARWALAILGAGAAAAAGTVIIAFAAADAAWLWAAVPASLGASFLLFAIAVLRPGKKPIEA